MSYCNRWLILPLIIMEHEIDGKVVFFVCFFIRLVIAHRVAFFKWGWIENKSNHEKQIDHCTCIVTSRKKKGKLNVLQKAPLGSGLWGQQVAFVRVWWDFFLSSFIFPVQLFLPLLFLMAIGLWTCI